MDSAIDDNDLSTALGTEALANRDIVPKGFENTASSRDSMPVELFSGRRYLKVE